MPDIELTKSDNTARLRLNRPAAFNALTPDLLRQLIELCQELEGDQSVRVVVLEGSGDNFCSGADLSAFLDELEMNGEEAADLGRRAKEAIGSLPHITIAAIHGYCIGGGIVLSAACDMRIASDNSRFSIPEIDAGIPLSWGATPDLNRLIGETVANDLVLTCRPFDAEEALRIDLVSRVLPASQFDSAVNELATKVAEKPAVVLRQTKQKLLRIRAGTFDATRDAADMVAALDDAEAAATNQAYLARVLGR